MLPPPDRKVPCSNPRCRRRFSTERIMRNHANISHPHTEVRYARQAPAHHA